MHKQVKQNEPYSNQVNMIYIWSTQIAEINHAEKNYLAINIKGKLELAAKQMQKLDMHP